DWNRHAQPGAGPAIRLADVGPSRFLETLQLPLGVRIANLGELGDYVASAALEDAKDVAGRKDLPRRQRQELGHNSVAPCHLRGRHDRRNQFCRLPVSRVGFAYERML